mgnify:CR=1 FL=1
MGLSDDKRVDKPQQCAECGGCYRPFYNSPKQNGEDSVREKCFGVLKENDGRRKTESGSKSPPSVNAARWISLGKGDSVLSTRTYSSEQTTTFGGSVTLLLTREIDGKDVALHHFVTGVPGHVLIDHRNRNPLDNRKKNLRVADLSKNGMNARKHRRGRPTSKYKGVWWDKSRSKWAAMIRAYKKSILSGRFASEEEAARAYDQAAKKLHGEFALLNFQNSDTLENVATRFGVGPEFSAQCPRAEVPDGWRAWVPEVDGPVPEALTKRAAAFAADPTIPLGSTESYPLPGVTVLASRRAAHLES